MKRLGIPGDEAAKSFRFGDEPVEGVQAGHRADRFEAGRAGARSAMSCESRAGGLQYLQKLVNSSGLLNRIAQGTSLLFAASAQQRKSNVVTYKRKEH
ncbi:MAG TPA: hypothetical protein VLT16_10890 [Candidatus Limnocylindrales bacterium]|nr:hypothetical protein [Candidatus Limnocylindrales bacterium]